MAYDWKIIPPEKFWDYSKQSQALMIAITSARNEMTGYEEEQMRIESSRKSKPSSEKYPRRIRSA